MEQFYVSVFMLVYNQEKYISQAIEGVLNQETDFHVELVIGEDCSTDKTREICKRYALKYPEKIKILLNKTNLGLGTNYVKTLSECEGKYVAICDGDDYWTDPLKLQKQVAFLEKNPLYSIVFTNNYSLLPNGRKIISKKITSNGSSDFGDLVLGNFIPSVTAVFRNVSLTKNMKFWIPDFPYADWPTYLLVTKDGSKIFYLDEITAVYRRDLGTSTALRKERSRPGIINLNILKMLLDDPEFNEQKLKLKSSIVKHKISLMCSFNREKKFRRSMKMFWEVIFQADPPQILRLYFYSLWRTCRSKKFNSA